MVKYLVIVLIIVALWFYFNDFTQNKPKLVSRYTQTPVGLSKDKENKTKMLELLKKLANIYKVELWRYSDYSLEKTFEVVEEGIDKYFISLEKTDKAWNECLETMLDMKKTTEEVLKQKDEEIENLRRQINYRPLAVNDNESEKLHDFFANLLEKKSTKPERNEEMIQRELERLRNAPIKSKKNEKNDENNNKN